MKTLRIVSLATLALCMVRPAEARMEIAANISGGSDYSVQPFKDVWHSARNWKVIPADSDWDYPHGHLGMKGKELSAVQWRDDGYPVEIPSNGNRVLSLVMVAQNASHYPYGTFTLLFEGTGEILLGWDAGGKAPAGYPAGRLIEGHSLRVTGEGGTTRYEFDINSQSDFFGKYTSSGNSSGILIHIMRSERSDPIRNISIIIPDTLGGTSLVENYRRQPFNPLYLNDIRPFSVYRPLGWGGDGTETSWDDRLTPDACYAFRKHKAGAGRAWEQYIQIANIMHRDIWITVPHKADDNYMAQLAKLFKEKLDPERKVYIEYSNEVWNNSFDQCGYAYWQGGEMGFPGPNENLWFQAARSAQLFKSFNDEFGENSTQVVRVIAGWHAVPDQNKILFTALNSSQANPYGVKPDAFATAPYIGGGRFSLADMRDHITEIQKRAVANRAIADAKGVAYITYEGGQHISRGGEDLIREINSDPDIYNVYMEYLAALEEAGVEMLNHFTAVSGWSEYGAWGAKEFVGQSMEVAHKYRALYDYMTASGQFTESEPRYWEAYAPTSAAAHAVPCANTQLSPVSPRAIGLNGRYMSGVAVRLTPQAFIRNRKLLHRHR